MICSESGSSSQCMEADREYTALMEGMRYAVEQVRASKFFTHLTIQIQENSEMVSNFKGAPMVVYGLGSLQYNQAAKFHLSLALLLREVPALEIQKEITICCDDIMLLTPAEEKVMRAYGCHVVLVTGGRFRWTVAADEHTLFFLPYTRPEVLGDLLQLNWCPSQLQRMLILGMSLKFMAKTLDPMVSRCNNSAEGHPKMTVEKLSYVMDRLRYLWGIKDHTEEFKITNTSLSPSVSESLDYLFEDLCWHVFNVDQLNIIEDMDILLPSTETCFKWVDDDERYPYRMDEEDAEELVKLQDEIEITKTELRNSEHYRKLRDQLEEDHLLKNEISRRLGNGEQMPMIIYALGSVEYSFASQYQLALALLMREDIDILRIGQIEVFDPDITPSDANLIRSVGCTVLSVNEVARRRVEKPTLFFLPFAGYNLVANLLEVNWVPSKLENLIILGTSMHKWAAMKEKPEPYEEDYSEIEKLLINDRLRYMCAINEWSVEFPIDEGHKCWPLKQLYWVFFNLHCRIDINSLLPSFSALCKIQVDDAYAYPGGDNISTIRNIAEETYSRFFSPNLESKRNFNSTDRSRAPRKYRKVWIGPQSNWIKLNFDGYGETDGNYGYGGILHDSNGDTLLSYAGPISKITIEDGNRDATLVAQVEGLRQGVICFKKWLAPTYDDPNLLIEGSALSVIRWARALFPPPNMFSETFKEMCVLLEGINCQVHHIYQEANIEASRLAQQGVTLSQLSSWS